MKQVVAEFAGDAALQEEGRRQIVDSARLRAHENAKIIRPRSTVRTPPSESLPPVLASAGHIRSSSTRHSSHEVDTTPLVRDRAYFLWEEAGRPYGREYEFWFKASREIEGDLEAIRKQAHALRIVAR